MSTRSVVADIISTLDFSQFNFKNINDVDLSSLNLSSFPRGDFKSADSAVTQLSELRESFINDLNKSRLSNDKKESSKKLWGDVTKLIDNYINAPESSESDSIKYSSLCGMRDKLSVMFIPTSYKVTISSILSILISQTDKLRSNMYERKSLLRELRDGIVEYSTKYRVNLLLEELKTTPLTIDFILKDNDHLIAARGYAMDKFGGGAYSLISSICYAKLRNHPYPIIEWEFDDDVYGTVKCAQALGVTKFAFSGKSTAALTNLNIITKLGLTFSIEELTFERTFGEVTEPLAVVNVA